MSIMPLEMRLNATCAATSLRMEPKFSEGGGGISRYISIFICIRQLHGTLFN